MKNAVNKFNQLSSAHKKKDKEKSRKTKVSKREVVRNTNKKATAK